MSHDYHEQLPGYSPRQILHDGCRECEARAQYGDRGISSLDPDNYRRAIARALVWERAGLADISDAELPLLRVLAAVEAQRRQAAV